MGIRTQPRATVDGTAEGQAVVIARGPTDSRNTFLENIQERAGHDAASAPLTTLNYTRIAHFVFYALHVVDCLYKEALFHLLRIVSILSLRSWPVQSHLVT